MGLSDDRAQEQLVEYAEHTTAVQLERIVRTYRGLRSDDEIERANRLHPGDVIAGLQWHDEHGPAGPSAPQEPPPDEPSPEEPGDGANGASEGD